jgi:ribosomal protein S18 acetylase RimI-like enzyme
MTEAEIAEFRASDRDAYIADIVAAGEDPIAAAKVADEQVAALFPDGKPAPGHLFYDLVNDGQSVGGLWIGPAPGGSPDACWIWNIVVYDAFRRRGIGRAAMLLAEQEARSRGAVEIGLAVFAHNTTARHLYDSLGYEAVATRMRKRLVETVGPA